MRRLRGGADIDHRDGGVPDDVLIIERGMGGARERLHLLEPIGTDLADMQLVHQSRARQRLRPDAAAPTGPDHRRFDLLHWSIPRGSVCRLVELIRAFTPVFAGYAKP